MIIKPLTVRAPMGSIVLKLTSVWRDGSVEKGPWSLSLGTRVQSLRTHEQMWQSSRILELGMERQEIPRASWPDRLSELQVLGSAEDLNS